MLVRALVAVVLGAGLLMAPHAQAEPPPAARKIDGSLQRGLAAAGTADFLVSFGARSNVAPSGSWAVRGRQVYDALESTARKSQRDVRKELDKAGVKYRAFSVANVIYVFGGTTALAEKVSAHAEVTSLAPARTYKLPEPAKSKAKAAAVDGLEWGVASIRADEVWNTFGTRGEGIVVANVDSGVQYDHPELAALYRGKQPDGSVRHDYNWFDPAAICPVGLGPCDNAGHGTHTMGTMVGDQGIGVAPGVKWIAAKGCEGEGCSSFALLSSAQWLLAPTDAQGENPRPDLRPNVVNNSWGGDNGPVEDPWYDEAIANWIDAGMFPAFANGNSGPGCDTAGTPGDSLLAYAVGAYAADGSIGSFSSRGPGADGTPKPNLAAPGVAVRSSLPGNAYGTWDGTSMATPHLAATVALMWSAAPALVGDIGATEALLDETAIDVDDTSCGGTAADNNVFGEGRLDAFRAVEASPRGPTGTLRGTVRTEAGDPVANATVTLTGTANRRLQTAPDGTFATLLSAGTYTAKVTAFGYAERSAELGIAEGAETVRDFALPVLPRVAISGTVKEGSAHGWPLYATITADDVPDGTFYTDPATGRYRFEVPANSSYTLRIRSLYPGLGEQVLPVAVGATDVSRDVELTSDPYDCTAPGYAENAPRVMYSETFDEPTTPAGWTVTDPLDNGQVWRFDDDRGFGNRTGGEGLYGWVFSADYGPDAEQDTSLVSPPVDLSGTTTPALWFNTDYSDGSSSVADVDVSVDGGATWTNVWHQTQPSVPESRELVALPQAVGKSNVRVRFHYTASFDGWWMVDNVTLGEQVCDTVPGGLVLGHVRDANTDQPLVGATVRHDGGSATTVSTPTDPQLADGFYWIFAPNGSRAFTASQPRYQAATRTFDVAADTANVVDLEPTAGVIEASVASLSGRTTLGGQTTANVTIRNEGTASARVDLGERPGDVAIQAASAPGPVRRVAGTFSTGAKPSGGVVPKVAPADTAGGPWSPLPDYPIAIMDNAVVAYEGELYSFGGRTDAGASNRAYRYDPESSTWTAIATMPRARQKAAVGLLNGKIYLAGGWASTGDARADVDVYDPIANTWAAGPSMPGRTTAAGTAVVGDQLYVIGGCITECSERQVFRFDASDRAWTRLADYPRDVAWQACGGIAGAVYCAGGTAEGGSSARTYRYDVAANTWTRLADLPISLWGMGSTVSAGSLLLSGGVTGNELTNEGFAYDPVSDSWSPLANSRHSYYRGGSACGFAKVGGSPGNFVGSPYGELLTGYADCGVADPVRWLRSSPSTVTIAPGASVDVTVTLDGTAVDQPGTYVAALEARDTTPYTPPSVAVSLRVDAPSSWGKLAGTVYGKDCAGVKAPLPGASVRYDGPLADRTLRTDAAGKYAVWQDRANSPATLVVTKDGWFPATGSVQIRAGQTTTKDFTLNRTGCPSGGNAR